jgi:hypothetical protein
LVSKVQTELAVVVLAAHTLAAHMVLRAEAAVE